MKKILKVLVFLGLLISIIPLSGCKIKGNESWSMGEYNFVCVYDIPHDCYYKIDKWHNDEVGIEIKTAGYGTIFFSEGTYILYSEVPTGVKVLEKDNK